MSKRKLHHPERDENQETSVTWTSLESLENTPAFNAMIEREFPSSAAMMEDDEDREHTRRDFVKLMGASTALAGFGLAACRRPATEIVPYTDAPEWVIPGKATYYASTFPGAKGSTPIVVTTFEGRPTKVEPSKIHPAGEGTDTFTQASVLNLYEPQRSRKFLKDGADAKRSEVEKCLIDALKKAKEEGKKVAYIAGEDVSPTRSRLANALKKHVDFFRYEALTGEGRVEAEAEVFGVSAKTTVDFNKAHRILSLDCDFLELDPRGAVKPFYNNRQPEGAGYKNANTIFEGKDKVKGADKLNRLYIAEGNFSLTGGMADHRKRLKPSDMGYLIGLLTKAVKGELSYDKDGDHHGPISDEKWAYYVAKDLKNNKGKSVILLGDRYEKDLHLAVHALNTAIGAYDGGALKALTVGEKKQFKSVKGFKGSDYAMAIVATPSNPAYDNAALSEELCKTTTFHFGERTDQTAYSSCFHIPAAHYLESWSDTRTAEGVYSIVQPMILPLYGGVSELELLVHISKILNKGEGALHNSLESDQPSPALTAVKAVFAGLSKDKSSKAWKKLLREGFLAGTKYKSATAGEASASGDFAIAKSSSLDVIFAADHSVYDGRYLNNAWLQEAPDPITKISWDNAALISPKTAKALGVYKEDEKVQLEVTANSSMEKLIGESVTGDVGPDNEAHHRAHRMIKIAVNGKEVEIPVVIAFGQADDLIILPLGYGQGYNKHFASEFTVKPLPDFFDKDGESVKYVGNVGVNRGFNAYHATSYGNYFTSDAQVTVTGARYKIAMTQEHHAMYGRALAREISTNAVVSHGHEKSYKKQLANVDKQGAVDSHAPQNLPIYFPKGSETWHDAQKADNAIGDKVHQWAMAIDLNVCNGCSACLVACQAENNIPVVGKKQLAMGREMHWIRMDRYFAAPKTHPEKGSKDKPKNILDSDEIEMIPQPVACQQCESAPCETVCPVNATVHTPDGINAMAYNRCIGTRYCANNCPYKARRFNFFDYNKRNPLLHKNLYKGPFGEKQVGEAPHLQRNPNVSVRMRGVMEKCNYCYQRLKSAIIEGKKGHKNKVLESGRSSENVGVTNADIRAPRKLVNVACEDACSAGAITFGNLLDEKDPIRRIKTANNELSISDSNHPDDKKLIERSYDLLNYVGTRPRTSYLARVKNPNPNLDHGVIGSHTINMGH